MKLPTALAQTGATTPETVAPALPAITVSTVSRRVLRDRVIGSGLVTPVERVLVQPLIEGQPIESLEVEVGDIVTKGQVLARLSGSTLKLQQSQLAASRASAVAAIAQAEAQLLDAKSASDEATRINERTQQLRAQGSSSQAAADTASSNAVSAAARVTVAVQGLEEASRLGQARVTIDDPTMVRTGMFMDAEVLVAERETLAVPVTAVGAGDTGATLMRVTDGLVERVPVELGIRDGGFVEVLSGVAAGDLIVTKAAAFVREGDKINPVPDAAGTN